MSLRSREDTVYSKKLPSTRTRCAFSFLNCTLAVVPAFMILYNISLRGLETFSTARLAVILLILTAFLHPKKLHMLIRKLDILIFIVFIPLPHVMAQYVFVSDFGQLSRFLNLFFYSYIGAILLARMVGSLDRWLLVILLATSIQAVILIYSFFSLSYREWFEANLVTGGNFGADYIYRAPGLTSDSGASLSVIQSVGVLAGCLLFFIGSEMTAKWHYSLFFLILLTALSSIVVGRTGFILSVLFIGIFVGFGSIGKAVIFPFTAIFSLLILVTFDSIQNSLPSNFSIDYFLTWAFGFIYGEDETLTTLILMSIPNLDSSTIFGTGLVSLVNGLNPSGHDSGFVQAYFSMGLIMSIVFYVCYLLVLVRLLKWLPAVMQYLIAILLFLIEFKEPFVFKYSILFFLIGGYTLWRDVGVREALNKLISKHARLQNAR